MSKLLQTSRAYDFYYLDDFFITRIAHTMYRNILRLSIVVEFVVGITKTRDFEFDYFFYYYLFIAILENRHYTVLRWRITPLKYYFCNYSRRDI